MSKPLIALLTNNDDDVYCFRKELIEGLLAEGYEMLISSISSKTSVILCSSVPLRCNLFLIQQKQF